LAELLFEFLIEVEQLPRQAADSIWSDYQAAGRSDRPGFLAAFVTPADTRASGRVEKLPTRQGRHLLGETADRAGRR